MQPAAPTPANDQTPAGLLRRLAALVYDSLLLIAMYFITMAIVGMGALSGAAHQHAWVVLPGWYRHLVMMPSLFLVTYLFYGYFWHKHGQTLGMQTWRLQTRRADGQPLSWGDGLRRMLAALVLPTLGGTVAWLVQGSLAAGVATLVGFFCNYFWMYTNPQGLSWHDQLSRTRVWRVPAKSGRSRIFGD